MLSHIHHASDPRRAIRSAPPRKIPRHLLTRTTDSYQRMHACAHTAHIFARANGNGRSCYMHVHIGVHSSACRPRDLPDAQASSGLQVHMPIDALICTLWRCHRILLKSEGSTTWLIHERGMNRGRRAWLCRAAMRKFSCTVTRVTTSQAW